MELNENEKKPKRPRIGQAAPTTNDANDFPRYEKVNYSKPAHAAEGDQPAEGAPRYQRPFNPRPNGYNNQNRQNGYYNNGGYNRQNNYQQRPRPTYNKHDQANPNAQDGVEGENAQPNNYQPRYNNYNNQRQGGYNNQNRQGGYNNQRQGGYNNQNRQGG